MASIVNKAKEMAGYGENQQTTSTYDTPTTSSTTTSANSQSQPTFQENVFGQDTTKTGPVHNSEVLNRADPRVHEHHTSSVSGQQQGTIDAASVPPSVMKQHLGAPSVEHDYPEDSTHKRHSVSHQEAHIMG